MTDAPILGAAADIEANGPATQFAMAILRHIEREAATVPPSVCINGVSILIGTLLGHVIPTASPAQVEALIASIRTRAAAKPDSPTAH